MRTRQGPRGIPGSGSLSAGFVTVTANTYYRWIFDADERDELAFGFAGPSSPDVAALWTKVDRALGSALQPGRRGRRTSAGSR